MPNYDYRCGGCGETFSAMKSIAERKVAAHEDCGGTGKQVILQPLAAWCDPMDPGFPDAHNAWADRHEKHQR